RSDATRPEGHDLPGPFRREGEGRHVGARLRLPDDDEGGRRLDHPALRRRRHAGTPVPLRAWPRRLPESEVGDSHTRLSAIGETAPKETAMPLTNAQMRD